MLVKGATDELGHHWFVLSSVKWRAFCPRRDELITETPQLIDEDKSTGFLSAINSWQLTH